MRPIRLLPLALLVAGLLAIPSTASADTCTGSLSGGFWTHITTTNTAPVLGAQLGWRRAGCDRIRRKKQATVAGVDLGGWNDRQRGSANSPPLAQGRAISEAGAAASAVGSGYAPHW
jgi:hypothetical protein